ncbi:LysR family transcriptional regulator [Amylibacter marinus]|uniref:LysR family transcriptional regulator n=1 Tax=Amylibacter marinus TaxID=1475483 RepID=A0ABQ5VXB8_9RHOB|nr:LysR family transcriptional regulator [Amylibacter marinus]GLQ36000.1 LysR family transcriptional regulator [Amylibacter marinus]
MDRIQSLEVFVAVSEAQSFAAGARSVGLSAPSATRGINALEARLGVRLFTRTTRQVRLTDIGATYLKDARTILAQLQAADAAAAGAAIIPKGRLRITCPNEFGRLYITPILAAYLDRFPDVSADVLMLDRVVNLVEEGVDIGVRIGALPSSGLTAVRVGSVRRVICGSAQYFEANGRPKTPSDLQNHKIVAASSLADTAVWRFGTKDQGSVRLHPRLAVTSIAAAIDIAKSGWGLARVLSYQIGPDLRAGRLETVLREFEPDPLPIHLVHPEGRRASAKLRSFVDFARDHLRKSQMLNEG